MSVRATEGRAVPAQLIHNMVRRSQKTLTQGHLYQPKWGRDWCTAWPQSTDCALRYILYLRVMKVLLAYYVPSQKYIVGMLTLPNVHMMIKQCGIRILNAVEQQRVLAAHEGLRGRNVLFINSLLHPLLKVSLTSIRILTSKFISPWTCGLYLVDMLSFGLM